ncbi:MAG: hypothetical protein WBX11_08230 [Thiobacillaceae bacterium]
MYDKRFPLLDFAGIAGVMMLLASPFVWIGLQTVRCRAKDILGKGIVSLMTGVFFSFSTVLANSAVERVLIASLAFLLICAGILALVGRPHYRAWRSTQQLD